MVANLIRARGRPRAFDPDKAMAIGQRLFHARGYDSVGVAELTDTLGIKPPSFYAAFGSKAAFFGRVLDRYASSVLALDDLLVPGRDPVEALSDLLENAARTYAADPDLRGCLVLESARGNDDNDSAPIARQVAERRRSQLRAFVAASHSENAAVVTDFISSTMSGLSSGAREGMSEARLLAVARVAIQPLPALLVSAANAPVV